MQRLSSLKPLRGADSKTIDLTGIDKVPNTMQERKAVSDYHTPLFLIGLEQVLPLTKKLPHAYLYRINFSLKLKASLSI